MRECAYCHTQINLNNAQADVAVVANLTRSLRRRSLEELDQVFESVSGYFALLAEPMRVRILHALCREERTVTDIIRETGGTQTNVSRHLNFMYRAGVLSRRKEGNFTWYSVSDSTLTELCRTVCVHIAARRDAFGSEQLAEVASALTAPRRGQRSTLRSTARRSA